MIVVARSVVAVVRSEPPRDTHEQRAKRPKDECHSKIPAVLVGTAPIRL